VSRTAVIVFDAPDLGLVKRLVAEGRMPTLAGFLSGGSSVRLESPQQGLLTGSSWTTLTSGLTPAQSGLTGSVCLVPGTYAYGHADLEAAPASPFWRHVSDAGLRSTVVSVYGSALLPDFLGTQVVGWGSHDSYVRDRWASDPPALADDLERRFGPRRLRYATFRPRGEEALRSYISTTLEGVGQQAAALEHLARETDWDLFAGAFADVHQAGHFLWHLAHPEHPEHDAAAAADLREGLAALHERADAAIGRVLAALPADTTVFMTACYTHRANGRLSETLPAVLEDVGLSVRHEGGPQSTKARVVGAGRRAARALLPLKARHALGRRVGRDRIVGGLALAHLDWTRTRAFATPADTSSSVRVNVAGREPSGSVPPSKRAAVMDEVREAVLALTDADTGEPVVARVERFEDLFGSEPWGSLPDLCIEWRQLAGVRALRTPTGRECAVPDDDERVTGHCGPGFLAARGPDIASSGTAWLGEGTADLLDVAPTVLAQMGVPQPAAMGGRPVAPLAGSAQRRERV
jgi:predicted AlkP superfamily phosphohydrolase/phosphomutase